MSDWLDAEAHADRALEMYERGRWAEAEAELRKALSLNPDHAEWHFNLGLTLEASGRDSDALESYQRALELMPDQADPLVVAAMVANRLDQPLKAIAWLETALKLDSSNEAAYACKIESHVRLANHEEAETTFYLAQHALSEPSSRCLAIMAESLIQRKIWERAMWCLKEALRLEPNMPRLRARLASVLAATGKPQRALQLYLKELRDDPGSIDTLLDYGDLLVQLGRLPEAAEKFRRILELEPANAEAHYRLGQIAHVARRYEQACLEFELVHKLDPQYPHVQPALAESLLRRGQIEEARALLVQAFELIQNRIGDVQPDQSESIAASREIGPEDDDRSSEPATVAELNRLGALLLEANEPVRAATLFEAALLQGESADLLRQLALARFRSGNHVAGAAASQRVLRLEPDCIRSIHNLALAALESGQLQLAAGWVRRGLRINHHDDGLRRVRIRVWLAQAGDAWRSVWRLTQRAQ
jgi:tetratricopeptide (TPR) repeat protein